MSYAASLFDAASCRSAGCGFEYHPGEAHIARPGRLYRGLVPPLMLEAPKRAVKFAANDFWGKTCVSNRSTALIVQLPRVFQREQDDAGPVGADGLHGRCDRGRRRRALRVRRQHPDWAHHAGSSRSDCKIARARTPGPSTSSARRSRVTGSWACTRASSRRSGGTSCGVRPLCEAQLILQTEATSAAFSKSGN